MKMTSLARPLTLFAAVFIALSFAIACGDDDGSNPTADPSSSDNVNSYFAHVQAIFQQAEDATNEAEGRLNETSPEADLDERLSALETYLGEVDTIFNEATGSLDGLSVPAAAVDGHQGFIDGVQVSLNAGNALRDDLQDISTEDGLDDRLAEFDNDVDAGVDQAAAACLALQEIADKENTGIDLNCES
ncbi:MAG TPA: hypothetical protein VIT93_04480 [Dehalococcoidia bacterium]